MAQLSQELIGHTAALKNLESILESQLESGAFIFSGPAGVGKRLAASALTQKLLCQRGTGCGECGDCHRVQQQTHESILIIDVESPNIKLEEAEKTSHFLRLKGLSQRRFVVINDAHKFNLSTANALLKTIEEPPEGVFFILITSQIQSLPATIRSRCRVIKFAPLSKEEVQFWQERTGTQAADLVATGQLGLIQSLSRSDRQDLFDLVAWTLFSWAKGTKYLMRDQDKSLIKNKDTFLFFINLLEMALRDVLVYSCESDFDNLYLGSLKSEWQALKDYSPDIWLNLSEQLQAAKKDLYLNPDPQLWLESFVFQKVI